MLWYNSLEMSRIRRGNKWLFCCHLNQGIAEAKDGALG